MSQPLAPRTGRGREEFIQKNAHFRTMKEDTKKNFLKIYNTSRYSATGVKS